MKKNIVEATLEEWGLPLSQEQLIKLTELVTLLEERGFPHTAITDVREARIKHVVDSLACLRLWTPPPHCQLLDLGSGAGFPGLVLKIAWPGVRVTLLEAARKKVQHLDTISRALQLDGVQSLHGRAEDVGRDPLYRESFDAVTARAVATTSVLAELCLPLVRVGGGWLVMKGPEGQREVDAACEAVATLGGQLEKEVTLDLPQEQGFRYLALIRKVKRTPRRYPRRAGIPQKRPL